MVFVVKNDDAQFFIKIKTFNSLKVAVTNYKNFLSKFGNRSIMLGDHNFIDNYLQYIQ